jgi:hypothetical protein
MIVGTVLVTAALVLAMQVTQQAGAGAPPSITLASQFGIPADRTFSDWSALDHAIHVLLYDIPVWFLLVLAAAVLYWLTDWTDEKLGLLFSRRRPHATSSSDASHQPLPQPSEMSR